MAWICWKNCVLGLGADLDSNKHQELLSYENNLLWDEWRTCGDGWMLWGPVRGWESGDRLSIGFYFPGDEEKLIDNILEP